MLRKQPDRFEMMVSRIGYVEAWRGDRKIYEADVLKLLRRQHRAYMRMVKRHLFAVDVMRDHPAKREQCVAIWKRRAGMEELDGMVGVNQWVADQKYPYCMDAMVWAEEFYKTFPSVDKMTMVGWFANAIMAGYDAAGMRCSGEIQALQAENAQLKLLLDEVRRERDDKDHNCQVMRDEVAQLKEELAQCRHERDGACNVVAGANHLLLKAGVREARLRDLLHRCTVELANDIEMAGGCEHEVGICCCETKWLLHDAKLALEEAGT